MSDTFFVGTRKGLFTVTREDGGWRCSEPEFAGDPVNIVFPDGRDGSLYAALPLGHYGVKLRRRDAGSTEWQECAVPTYPKVGDEEPAKGESLEEIWAMESAGPDKAGTLWCGTIPGGLFRSSDRGESWQLIESLWDVPERANWFGGGKDYPGIHSICVDPRDTNRLTVGVSCGGSWYSDDFGETWELRAKGMHAAYMPPDRASDESIQDPHLVAQCSDQPDVLWTQHHNGIFRSTDQGKSWQSIDEAGPSVFGFAVAVHPTNPDRAWFVPAVKDECRIPVDGKFVVTRTSDAGQTFEILSDGLPRTPAYHIVFRHALAIDATGERLAMGSSTGGLWISEDSGDSWQLISNDLPMVYCIRFAA